MSLLDDGQISPHNATVYVIGAGVDPARHLTIEAIEALRTATFVRSATSFNPPFMVAVEIGALDTVAPSATPA